MEQEQKKRSIIETIIKWFAILFVIFVIAMFGFLYFNPPDRHVRQMDQISIIMMTVKKTFSLQDDYKGLNNEVLIDLGTFVRNITSDGRVENAYGGEVSVLGQSTCEGALGTAPLNGCYTIQITNIPKWDCSTITGANWGDSDIGLLDITVLSDGEDITNMIDKEKTAFTTVLTTEDRYISTDEGIRSPSDAYYAYRLRVEELCAGGKNRITFLVK